MVTPALAAGARVVGAKVIKGQVNRGIAASIERKTATNNARSIAQGGSIKNATVSNRFLQKYTQNQNVVSRSIAIRNAALQKKMAQSEINENISNKTLSNTESEITKKSSVKPKSLKSKVKVTAKLFSVILMISGFLLPFWLAIQLPVTLFGLVGLSFEFVLESVPGGGWISSFMNWLSISGFTLFGISYGLNIIIGIFTMGSIIFMLSSNFIKPFKETTSLVSFLACLCLYCIPLLQIFPWFFMYLYFVYKDNLQS